ncbi:MAG: addiction module protein [Oleiphilaceae bacterium]|nr:addiction module protein [Oleiphilaceae bacterium]
MRIQELIDEASALPVDERALVVESLLKSLNPTETGIDEKWAEVAENRLAELESGQVSAVSGEEVFRKIRSRLNK